MRSLLHKHCGLVCQSMCANRYGTAIYTELNGSFLLTSSWRGNLPARIIGLFLMVLNVLHRSRIEKNIEWRIMRHKAWVNPYRAIAQWAIFRNDHGRWKHLQFPSYQASTTFSISTQTALSLFHNLSLHVISFFFDVLAMAPLTVADKIGQLRHLRERGYGLARKHVRILHSTAQNFSPFASVFVSGNRIGQVADKWQGGEGKRDIDSHFTLSHEADKSPPPFFRVCRTMCQGCYLCPVSIKRPVKHTHLCEMMCRHSFYR